MEISRVHDVCISTVKEGMHTAFLGYFLGARTMKLGRGDV